MDPITDLIVSALAKLSESVINDAYQSLKMAIIKRVGGRSKITKAIEGLEKRPDSQKHKNTLDKEIRSRRIAQEDDIIKLTNALKLALDANNKKSSVKIKQKAGDSSTQIGIITGDVHINNK